MVRAARLYRHLEDESWARWAAGQSDFYAENYRDCKIVRPWNAGRLFWQSLTEAVYLNKFLDTGRLLGSHVANERRERWRQSLFYPEVEVLRDTYRKIHHIACWQRGAMAQVALLFDDDALWRKAVDGECGLRQQLAEGVTSDYLWFEQSMVYNSYATKAFGALFLSAGMMGRAEALADEMSIVQNLMFSQLYYRFQDGKLPNPADSGAPRTTPDHDLLAGQYRVFPTALGLQ